MTLTSCFKTNAFTPLPANLVIAGFWSGLSILGPVDLLGFFYAIKFTQKGAKKNNKHPVNSSALCKIGAIFQQITTANGLCFHSGFSSLKIDSLLANTRMSEM